HGEVADGFGSAKSPATPEAIAVHSIENLDAKLMMALTACRGDSGPAAGDGNWTEYMKAFGGRLYRPDVAPSDAPVEVVNAPKGNGQPGTLKISNPLFETTTRKP